MNRKFWPGKLPIALLLGAALFAVVAWQERPVTHTPQRTDTVPDKQKKIVDVDDAINELEKSRIEMEGAFDKVDLEKMREELRASMKDLNKNLEKMKLELDQQLKQLDREKIRAQVDESIKALDAARMMADLDKELAAVDKEKIRAGLDQARKELDAKKIMAEVDASIGKIDREKLQKEMEMVREKNMKQIEEKMAEIGPKIKESMAGARQQIEKARTELKAYKGFIDGLEQDGLINKSDSYTIEWKKGELTINGKKQPGSVVEKYSDFLKGKKDFTIKKSEGDFNINND
jgi:hypothetical protein